MTVKVVKARREKIKVPILLMGASGSGKTLGSLLIAKGMVEAAHPKLAVEKQWEKIGLIDTEHRRSDLYVDTTHDHIRIGEFTKVDLDAPFTVAKYTSAFEALQDAGCEVIIIDSISSAWNGEGGITDQVDSINKGIQGWKAVAPYQREFLHLLTGQDVHVIATARSKQGVEVTTDDNGKVQVEKVGLKMEQKDSLEYEFAVAFQLYQNHVAQATKDNSSIFTQPQQLNREVGKKIYEWAEQGVDVQAEEQKRVEKAVKLIEDITAKSEAASKQVERAVATNQGTPIDRWTLVAITQLYKELVATVEATKPKTAEKEGK